MTILKRVLTAAAVTLALAVPVLIAGQPANRGGA